MGTLLPHQKNKNKTKQKQKGWRERKKGKDGKERKRKGKKNFNKYIIQKLKGHSVDDVVNNISHIMKTFWQNELTISVLF